MDEEYERYLELYPVWKCLQEEISAKFIGTGKNVKVGKGNTTFVDSTFGEMIYDKDVEHVSIRYFLQSKKFKKLIIEKLSDIYSEYYGSKILDEGDNGGFLSTFAGSCNLIVQIPCEDNMGVYLRANPSKKQQLKVEAYQNIQNGIAEYPNARNTNGKSL